MGGNRFFYDFVQRLIKRYDGLFDEDAGEDEVKHSSAGNFNKKWGGYVSIAVLAGNNITRFEEVTRLNVHECLTFLSYKKDLGAFEAEVAKMRSQMGR